MVLARNYYPWATLLLLALLWAPIQALAATEVGKVLATRGEVSAAAADGQTRALKRGASLFEGDTVYARSEVTETRESKSRPRQGIVGFSTEGYNQNGETVLTFRRTMLVYRRGHVPSTPRPQS